MDSEHDGTRIKEFPASVVTNEQYYFKARWTYSSLAVFLDRVHFYLLGWELGKTHDDLYTSQFGFLSRYLAEMRRGLPKTSYMDLAERHFAFGPTWAAAMPRRYGRRSAAW